MSATILPRRFKLGQLMLDDPDTELSPNDAVRIYQATYPVISSCTLAEPYEQGGYLVYELQKPAATTKGREQDSDMAEAMAELDAWEQNMPAPEIPDQGSLQALYTAMKAVRGTTIGNPLDIPLA